MVPAFKKDVIVQCATFFAVDVAKPASKVRALGLHAGVLLLLRHVANKGDGESKEHDLAHTRYLDFNATVEGCEASDAVDNIREVGSMWADRKREDVGSPCAFVEWQTCEDEVHAHECSVGVPIQTEPVNKRQKREREGATFSCQSVELLKPIPAKSSNLKLATDWVAQTEWSQLRGIGISVQNPTDDHSLWRVLCGRTRRQFVVSKGIVKLDVDSFSELGLRAAEDSVPREDPLVLSCGWVDRDNRGNVLRMEDLLELNNNLALWFHGNGAVIPADAEHSSKVKIASSRRWTCGAEGWLLGATEAGKVRREDRLARRVVRILTRCRTD